MVFGGFSWKNNYSTNQWFFQKPKLHNMNSSSALVFPILGVAFREKKNTWHLAENQVLFLNNFTEALNFMNLEEASKKKNIKKKQKAFTK